MTDDMREPGLTNPHSVDAGDVGLPDRYADDTAMPHPDIDATPDNDSTEGAGGSHTAPIDRRLRCAGLISGSALGLAGLAAIAWWVQEESRPHWPLTPALPSDNRAGTIPGAGSPQASLAPRPTDKVGVHQPDTADHGPNPDSDQLWSDSANHVPALTSGSEPAAARSPAENDPTPADLTQSHAVRGHAGAGITDSDARSPITAATLVPANRVFADLKAGQDRLFQLRLQLDEARLRAEICDVTTTRERPDWCDPVIRPSPTPMIEPAVAASPEAAAPPPPRLAAVAGRPNALVAVFLGPNGPIERRAGDRLGAWRIDRIDSNGRVRLTGPGGALILMAGQ